MKTFSIIAVILVAAAALSIRVDGLDARPMHGDEANQAHKAGRLLETGVYQYDPHEHHGPTLYYLAALSARIRGETTFADTTEFTYRIIPVVFSALLILGLLLVRNALGNSAIVWAALLMAMSPALTFYSRYFIQETLLITFTFALIAFGWRYTVSGKWFWAVAAGLALGLMHATKETSIIAVAAIALALVATVLYSRWRDGGSPKVGEETVRSAQSDNPFVQSDDAATENDNSTRVPPPSDRLGVNAASDASTTPPSKFAGDTPVTRIRPQHIIAALVAATAVSALFYSSFFTHPRGILDSVLTYTSYLGRAAADQTRTDGAAWHEQPWHYYLTLLAYTKKPFGPVWTEGLILGLAILGAMSALLSRSDHASNPNLAELRSPFEGGTPKGRGMFSAVAGGSSKRLVFARFLTFYAIAILAAYSLIPYKTPWNVLTFLHAATLLAGIGAASLLRFSKWTPVKIVLSLALIAGAAQLGYQSHRANYDFNADPRNPYVYAHTSTSALKLAERIQELAALNPNPSATIIKVILPNHDYWPLPWYLRKFENVGFYGDIPADPNAPLIVSSPRMQDAIAPQLNADYELSFYSLRPGVIIQLYVQRDLWNSFMSTRS